MRRMTIALCCLCMAAAMPSLAQKRNWVLEAEDPHTVVTWNADQAEIISPKGSTLWYKEKMRGDVTIEYEAMAVLEPSNYETWNRVSDLNCFWMASDPAAPDVFTNLKARGGRFVNSYALRLYYVGFGGNGNTTTRFRRYKGDARGIDSVAYRPLILREYTDSAHLIKPNHWHRFRLESKEGRVRYYVDGQLLVDWLDPNPLNEGWFGFRTTLSHTRFRRFSFTQQPTDKPVALRWISEGERPLNLIPTTFGVPFDKGEVMPDQSFMLCDASGGQLDHDAWNLAYWQDGSVKWKAFAVVAPPRGLSLRQADAIETQSASPSTTTKKNTTPAIKHSDTVTSWVTQTPTQVVVDAGYARFYVPKQGTAFLDSILILGRRVGGAARLRCSYDLSESQGDVLTTRRVMGESHIDSVRVERAGKVSCVLKVMGHHLTAGEPVLPFVIRLYAYRGSDDIKLVHTVVIDSLSAERKISSLGIAFDVPMRERAYNRHIWLDRWTEPVQPLASRRMVRQGRTDAEALQVRQQRVTEPEQMDSQSRQLTDQLAQWDRFRLSQLSPKAFSIRKAATDRSPWIGTVEGTRADGSMFVGDVSGGLALSLRDFWQAFPSSLEVRNARSDNAEAILWLWSPEAEPMNIEHYDTIAHGLDASYEDVQPGMSTARGVARTSVAYIRPLAAAPDSAAFASISASFADFRQLACTPEYLHRKRAFGIWSLPHTDSERGRLVEQRLSFLMDFYKQAIERHGWYGFWNYGDVMHRFDPHRREWMYDVGGFAWDNTELASNMMLWYNFLRTADPAVWRMAEAMTRHTAEVDAYHDGPFRMLGSRHNVSHWGCGAKEARISQAAWNRFYYYLTADERTGDLMTEVRDADSTLYHLDPMRLAQPRSLYPCTAPARLRIGPDWLAYAANWMTEWERTQNTTYHDKILTGMNCIAAFRHGIFSGPKALGFYPDSGAITNECDTALQNTNHLLPIMGGFEVMNEMIPMMDCEPWNQTWLNFCRDYKEKARTISNNRFLIPRLHAYAGWLLGDKSLTDDAWNDLLRFKSPSDPILYTNDAATWILDAIFLQEVGR